MKEFLSPSLTQALFSLKTFAAAMLALAIALHFNLERPYWALGTVYIVSNPLSGVSTSKALYRLLGTVIGGIMVVVLVPNLANSPEILTFCMAAWVAICLFFSMLDRRPRGYAFILSGYTVVIAGFPMVNTPELAFSYATARVEEIGLGVICAALVNRLVLPVHAGPVLYARVSGWLKDAADLAHDTLNGSGTQEKGESEQRRLAAAAVDMRGFSDNVSYDTSRHKDMMPLMQAVQQRMISLLPLMSVLNDQISALRPFDGNHLRLQKIMADTSAWMTVEGPVDVQEAARLMRETKILQQEHQDQTEWDSVLTMNMIGRLRNLIDVWSECKDLLTDLEHGEARTVRSKKALKMARPLPQHRDVTMAVLGGLSAFVAIVLANSFWMLSDWSGGVGVAQLAGVFCCILAGLDNIVPALRKFLTFTILAMIEAFLVNYLILPHVNGFVPLVAVLGFFLIPAGLLVTRMQTFMLGMCLCVNFIFTMGIQGELVMNYQSTAQTDIAMALAMICSILSCSLVRSIGAEASIMRVTHQAWKRVARIASRTEPVDTVTLTHALMDAVGINAPRLAAISEQAKGRAGDLIRDLRAAINVTVIQECLTDLDPPSQRRFRQFLGHVERFYSQRRAVGPRSDPAPVLADLDQCLNDPMPQVPQETARTLRSALVGMRVCLAPQQRPQSVIRSGHPPTGLPPAAMEGAAS